MDSSTLDKVIEESAWRRQWFRLQHATLNLKKMFLSRAWQTGVPPLQVAAAHDTMLVPATTVSVHDTRSSKRVHLLVKQTRKHWMERQVTEVNVAAESGNLKPLYQFCKNAKMGPKDAVPLFLPSRAAATTPQEVASVWRHHIAKDFDHLIRSVPFENLAKSLQEIRTQVQTCDTSEDTLVAPACNSVQEIRTDTREDKTQQDEGACDPVAQVEPRLLDWVDGRALTGRRYRTFWQGNQCRFYPSGGVPCDR